MARRDSSRGLTCFNTVSSIGESFSVTQGLTSFKLHQFAFGKIEARIFQSPTLVHQIRVLRSFPIRDQHHARCLALPQVTLRHTLVCNRRLNCTHSDCAKKRLFLSMQAPFLCFSLKCCTTISSNMAQHLAASNGWSNSDTVVPMRLVSYTDPEKTLPPLEEAQAGVPTLHSSNPSNSEPHSTRDRPTSLDWDGPDDPLNPHNWPSVRRWFQTYTISGVALVGTFASSVFTPGISTTAAEFGSPVVIATLAFSIYQLGLAFGGPFAAPLSESFGRKPVVFISLPIFALFVLGTGFAQSMATLIVLRFFAGFFAAPSLSMGSGTLSDLWQPEKRSGPMSMYVAAPFFGYVPQSWK